MVATLAIAGLLSGGALVGIYLWTLPRIRANQQAALERAITEVLPGTEAIATYELVGGVLGAVEEGSTEEAGERVYAGRAADGSLLGYAIPADGPGFMDTIGLIYGYDPHARSIVGLAVLESRETPGLGDKIVHDAEFLANFSSLAIDPEIVPVKGDASERNEVDCITGATISSEAVVSILNRSTARWADLLGGESDERSAEGGSP
jgi:electron transport complex protein RnfG